MKKSALFLLVLICLSFVTAEDSGFISSPIDQIDSKPVVDTASVKQIASDAKTAIKNTSSNIEIVLAKDIEFSEETQIVMKILFGLKPSDPITFQSLVVMCALWICLFTVLFQTSKIMFKGWTGFLITFLVTMLISFTRVIYQVQFWIFSFGETVSSFKFLNLLAIILILFIFVTAVSKLLRTLREKAEVVSDKSAGRKIGRGAGAANTMANTLTSDI